LLRIHLNTAVRLCSVFSQILRPVGRRGRGGAHPPHIFVGVSPVQGPSKGVCGGGWVCAGVRALVFACLHRCRCAPGSGLSNPMVFEKNCGLNLIFCEYIFLQGCLSQPSARFTAAQAPSSLSTSHAYSARSHAVPFSRSPWHAVPYGCGQRPAPIPIGPPTILSNGVPTHFWRTAAKPSIRLGIRTHPPPLLRSSNPFSMHRRRYIIPPPSWRLRVRLRAPVGGCLRFHP